MKAYARARTAGDTPTRNVPSGLSSSAGQRLDAQTRRTFESRFAHDFSQVRVHADAAANRSANEHGALAYTFGRDIVFASGQYRPHTPAGDRLLAHELAHVVEQHHAGAPSIQRQVDPTRSNQAQHATAPAQAGIARLQAGAPYFLFNFRTGNGLFDAIYDPPYLYVSVRVAFHFYPTTEEQKNNPEIKGPVWEESEMTQWKDEYLTEVSKKWTGANFVLRCAEPGWESLTAQVIVRFADVQRVREAMPFVEGRSIAPHWTVQVQKVSRYTAPTAITRPSGVVELNSEALRWWKTPASYQRAAVHESGHMLGLADLYANPENPALQKAFQQRAKNELGVVPPIGHDTRMMSGGETISSSDAVSFVEAIQKITGKNWSILPVKRPDLAGAPKRKDGGAP